jgi:hypothetical protein
VKATEGIERLEELVAEFGDFELQMPDPVERWHYPVDRIESSTENQAFRLVSDH